MRRTVTAALASLLTLAWMLVAAPAAHAAGAPITRMDIQASLDAQGRISVTHTLDMHFTGSNDHGPYLFFTTRHEVPDDPSRWRVLRYTVQDVTSPTNAPAQWKTEARSGTLAIRIGSPNRTVRGTQTYVLRYTIDGVINPKVASSGFDEVFWNVVGKEFTSQITNLSVRIDSPSPVSQTQCWTGSNLDRPCTSNAHQSTAATYQQSSLSPGEGLTVVAGWPAGTYPVEPIYEPRSSSSSSSEPVVLVPRTPWTIGGTGIATLAVGSVFWALARRQRDMTYEGLTPGLRPAPGETAATVPAGKPVVTVQFTPPEGVGPGMMGTLIDKKADLRDVTATIINLAVRGYLRVEQTGPGRKDFQLVRTGSPDGLLPHEAALFTRLFPGEATVMTSAQLQDKSFASTVQEGKTMLYQAVTASGWFTSDPSRSRTVWFVLAAVLGAVTGLTLVLPPFQRGLWVVGVPAAVAAVGALVCANRAGPRTADGTAVYLQSLGFRQYLTTAEADQIRWEEGQDIFSRYLPYAIAFDCADRWASVFRELAARGVDLPEPTWYINPYAAGHGFGFASSVDSMMSSLTGFSESAATALQAATSGSSGGSGFSSGGFSGGGGGGIGGGGGGSW